VAPLIGYPESKRRLDALDTAELNLLILEWSIAMTRPLGCFAALVIAALGSVPASATDRQASTTTVAMNESVETRDQAGAPHAAYKPIKRASDVSAAIAIDPTDAADYSYRGQFQAERGFLELAVSDLQKAVQLDPENDDYRDLRNKYQHKLSLQAFAVTAATYSVGLTDGFSRVAYYR
jgi:tetratricopeptide (TPR) repeat protein